MYCRSLYLRDTSPRSTAACLTCGGANCRVEFFGLWNLVYEPDRIQGSSPYSQQELCRVTGRGHPNLTSTIPKHTRKKGQQPEAQQPVGKTTCQDPARNDNPLVVVLITAVFVIHYRKASVFGSFSFLIFVLVQFFSQAE